MTYKDQFRARVETLGIEELRDLVCEIEREYAKVSLERSRLLVRVRDLLEAAHA